MNNNNFQWAHTLPADISEEIKTKVCIIRDINSMTKLMTGHDLNGDEFNYLYDMSLEQLQEKDAQTKLTLEGEIRWAEYQKIMRGRDHGSL